MHVVASVGSLGAVAVFLALAVAGLIGDDPLRVRGAYLAMETAASFVIVPLLLASLMTGLVQSLGTKWGLFRHYWVLVKLLMTVFATIVLLLHMRPIGLLAGVAAHATVPPDLRGLQVQLAVNAGAALLLLVVVATLSVFKPQGLTRYGWRRLKERRTATQP